MTNIFDGKKIRDEILADLKIKVGEMLEKPVLAVFWIGENQVSGHYVSIKKKIAEDLGVSFDLIKMDADVSQEEVLERINKLNQDPHVKGIMTQIPLPDHLNQKEIIGAIDPSKDIDGLRYCMEMESAYVPPVVMAVLEAIKRGCHSEVNAEESQRSFAGAQDDKVDSRDEMYELLNDKNIAVIGHGFLVGAPLVRAIDGNVKSLSVADSNTDDISLLTENADIIISATGVAHIIKPEMVKEGVVLIDAGTSEISGELKGDIAPEAFKKASYYTPVPGGIGPVTIAMLMKNLLNK